MTLTGRDKLQMHRKSESMENASTYTSQLNEGEALKKRGEKVAETDINEFQNLLHIHLLLINCILPCHLPPPSLKKDK